MAEKTWVSVTGDWSLANSWSPSGVPVNTDSVVFTGDSQVSVTAGLDQSAVQLTDLIVHDAYQGTIGTGKAAAESLTIDVSGSIIHQGRSAFYYYCGDLTPNRIIVDSSNWERAFHLFGDAGDSGTLTTLTVLRGMVEMTGAAGAGPDIDYLNVSYRSNPLGDAMVRCDGGFAATSMELQQNGGLVTFGENSDVSNVNAAVAGGRLVIEAAVSDELFLMHQSGGFVDLRNRDSATTKVVATARIAGGVCTLMNDIRIGLIDDLIVFPGATMLIPDQVTVTAGGNFMKQPIS